MSIELVFATNNAHKAEEVAHILAGRGIVLRLLRDFPDVGEVPETGDTFVDNAFQKARYVHERTGLLTVADDSGIEVDALDGRPGVHSKRYSDEGTDDANNALLLAELQGKSRIARFRCVIAVVGEDWEQVAEGRVEGSIAEHTIGDGGFGYDPLFLPDETPGRSMAQLTMKEKNRISHRGRAFRRLTDLLP
jgi:XTP/dITP diphosphohydrolase